MSGQSMFNAIASIQRRVAATAALGLVAVALVACSLTPEERADLSQGVTDTVLLAIEETRAIGVDPTIEVDADVLKTARLACRLADIGSPLLTSGINILVKRYNEDAETPAEELTVDEFRGHVTAGCSIVEQILVEEEAETTT